jgi:hypothetical protein
MREIKMNEPIKEVGKEEKYTKQYMSELKASWLLLDSNFMFRNTVSTNVKSHKKAITESEACMMLCIIVVKHVGGPGGTKQWAMGTANQLRAIFF